MGLLPARGLRKDYPFLKGEFPLNRATPDHAPSPFIEGGFSTRA